MKEIFAIPPPSGHGLWLALGCIVAMMVGLAALFAWFGYSAFRTQYEVSPEGLAIRGAMYGRRIPLRELNIADARVIDLSRDTGYRLALRTNGVGLPGYKGGWFRLQNGQKALVFYTGGNQAVSVPTQRDLLVTAEPRASCRVPARAAPRR